MTPRSGQKSQFTADLARLDERIDALIDQHGLAVARDCSRVCTGWVDAMPSSHGCRRLDARRLSRSASSLSRSLAACW